MHAPYNLPPARPSGHPQTTGFQEYAGVRYSRQIAIHSPGIRHVVLPTSSLGACETDRQPAHILHGIQATPGQEPKCEEQMSLHPSSNSSFAGHDGMEYFLVVWRADTHLLTHYSSVDCKDLQMNIHVAILYLQDDMGSRLYQRPIRRNWHALAW